MAEEETIDEDLDQDEYLVNIMYQPVFLIISNARVTFNQWGGFIDNMKAFEE